MKGSKIDVIRIYEYGKRHYNADKHYESKEKLGRRFKYNDFKNQLTLRKVDKSQVDKSKVLILYNQETTMNEAYEELKYSKTRSAYYKIKPIASFNNEERFFLNENIKLKMNDKGQLEVRVRGEKYVLKQGQGIKISNGQKRKKESYIAIVYQGKVKKEKIQYKKEIK